MYISNGSSVTVANRMYLFKQAPKKTKKKLLHLHKVTECRIDKNIVLCNITNLTSATDIILLILRHTKAAGYKQTSTLI